VNAAVVVEDAQSPKTVHGIALSSQPCAQAVGSEQWTTALWIADRRRHRGGGDLRAAAGVRSLSPEDVAGFTTPIATTDRSRFYLQVFQQMDGRWYQCKTWLSRQFFF
jgi:hypothetical protein